jgi:hypothetical protein
MCPSVGFINKIRWRIFMKICIGVTHWSRLKEINLYFYQFNVTATTQYDHKWNFVRFIQNAIFANLAQSHNSGSI